MLTKTFFVVTLLIPISVLSQSIPDVPLDLEFANITIHLTQPNRLKLKQEIKQLYTQRANVDYIVNTTRQLAPVLDPLLRESNIPNDFIYAAIPHSIADTLGFWGLSQGQGKRLKLQIDDRVDERFHLLASTKAVLSDINYWQKLQNNFASALLLYLNDGIPPTPDRVSTYYLSPSEKSGELFWKVLARKIIFEHEDSAGTYSSTFVLYNYRDAAGKTLDDVANQLQIPEIQVKTFNRWLKADQIPVDKDYSLFIQIRPEEFPRIQSLVESNKDLDQEANTDIGFPVLVKIPELNKSVRGPVISYRINGRKGIQAQNCDNAITLAFYGNISVESFLKYNDLNNPEDVHPGEVYYLEPKMKRAQIPFHIVRKDQTLRSISALYGIKLKSLEKFNHVSSVQRLQAGRVLWLQLRRKRSQSFEYLQQPETKPDDTPIETPAVAINSMDIPTNTARTTKSVSESNDVNAADTTYGGNNPATVLYDTSAESSTETDIDYSGIDLAKTHKVKFGETYYSIARLYAITTQQLYAWNKRTDWNMLQVGDELMVGPVTPASVDLTAGRQKPGTVKRITTSEIDTAKQSFFYIVKPGQTLYRISIINKVTVVNLMRWNDLVSYTVKVGQQLIIRK